MSSVSWAIRSCLASGSDAIVRMLWRRSASLISSTRMSFAIATSILRKRRGLLGVPRVELEPVELGDAVDDRGDLGAERAIPGRPSVSSVSSTASWSSAAEMVTSSRPRSARMSATPSGWEM